MITKSATPLFNITIQLNVQKPNYTVVIHVLFLVLIYPH